MPRSRPSEWAVYVVFEDGEKRYIARDSVPGSARYVRARGSSMRFESESAARSFIDRWAHNSDRISERAVEEIVNPRTTGT